MLLRDTERLTGFAATFGAAALLVLSVLYLTFWPAAILWATFAVALAVCSRQGWLKLVGPVLLYDMIRTARRVRYHIMRMLYAGLLLFILCYLVLILSLTGDQQILHRQTAVVAEGFFLIFIVIQLAVVVILTPAYVAGAIAEEKDRKTLEFLMATDLRDGEIILSKLLSRLANMSLLLITGLPILAILQFLGGVDTELVLAGFAAVGLTMLGIAGISMMVSTMLQKPRDAINLAYLLLFAYAAIGTIGMVMQISGVPVMSTPIWFGEDPYTVKDAMEVVNSGNPIAAVIDVTYAINGRTRAGGVSNLAAELSGILTRYAWFHLSLAFLTIGWCILRLRPIALKQNSEVKEIKQHWWQGLRPRIGNSPMFWKEFFIEGRLNQTWLAWLVLILLILATLGSGLWIASYQFDFNQFTVMNWHALRDEMNVWFRVAGTSVACLMLLTSAVRASTSITHERERDTLDALVTTPMTAVTMLSAKLLGSLMGARLMWVWYLSILAMAVLTGGVHPLAVPLLLISWFIYALAGVMIGLWFSMVSKSSMLATFYTVMTSCFVGGGHWVVLYCCGMPLVGVIAFIVQNQFPNNQIPWENALYIVKFLAGLTPPAVFGFAAFSWDELARFNAEDVIERTAFYFVGLFIWSGACVIMWFALLVPRFQRLTRRIELIYK